MKTQHNFVGMAKNVQGFTLVETMIAMVVLTVGILALYTMQTTSIRYNATANAITGSSTWAAEQIEQLLALDYNDPQLTDTDLNGTAGLDATGAAADGQATSSDQRYSISWNIADQMNPNPNDPTISTVKAVRVIVQHSENGINRQVVLNYFKQRLF